MISFVKALSAAAAGLWLVLSLMLRPEEDWPEDDDR